jgi:peptidoglycan hydrolase CwlO-like protein
MSKKTKIIIWIVVAVVVIGIIWLAVTNSRNTSQSNMNGAGTTANGNSAENTIVSAGTSDSDLNQDMNNINAQIDGLASDTASVDGSMPSSGTTGQ